jgi:4-hydroxy-tetrahydrodipicolinate reductase
MNILLLGYGKMGQMIAHLALGRNHTIAAKINIDNLAELESLDTSKIDVAIDFSQPHAAPNNIKWCIDHGIPVAVGTTGWLDQKTEIDDYCRSNGGTYLFASNFSIGVNIFFKVNQFLAKLMNGQADYDVAMKEIHHTHKLDAPSGTAITLAQGILDNVNRKEKWINSPTDQPNELSIISERVDPAPGTHSIHYDSKVDSIEITHTAHSREGFAMGALLVAEWLPNQSGIKTMDDFLKF